MLNWAIVNSWLRNLRTRGKGATVCLLRVFGRMGRGIDRWVRSIEPWGVFLAFFTGLVALIVALVALSIELDDRQSQRIIRAWEVVFDAREILASSISVPAAESLAPGSSLPPLFHSQPALIFHPPPVPVLGSGVRQALQFLNSEFEESGCCGIVHWLSKLLAGNRSRPCIFPDKKRESFQGLRLPRIDISEAQLPDVDLTEANLTEANLTEANLTEANLTKANLSNAHLDEANLSGADLTGANLSDAVLTRAGLAGAVLTTANLSGASLVGADLSDAVLSGADLTGADLSGADLIRVNLSEMDLIDVTLTGANLTEVDLTDATLALVDMRGTKFDDVQLPDIQDNMCIWHDATGPTQSWPQPADSCRERLLKFLTDLACQNPSTAEAVVRRYADISEPDKPIPSRILNPTAVARVLLEISPGACPALEPHREQLRQISALETATP